MNRLIDMKIGEVLNEISLEPVSRIDLIKYAGASGDFNPIHTIDKEATKAGLPGIIAHGMWTMGNLSKLFTPYLEEGFIQDYKIRFADMVFLDDVITLKAVLDEVHENYLDFDVMAVKANGKVAIKGNVRFKIYQ
ncbi:MaoC/PaaZ C-terminal domain-containing protein [Oceanobacillus sp. Castelsardo]|uniref:MaoC/PaaZ C-terminal domain-containing protein n=1 Tax=Oceanobacillus sp. Castelsardo TaxID=1851204 RepID=UPI000839ADA3|nr:MaoC/PaaZ C-terminal domain-containing protein [Oceanobacillus sp. Castelsardo]